MNKRVSMDSIIISLIAAAAIKFAYGVENIYVVLGINITIIIGLYFILSSYNKNTKDKEAENRKNIIELIENNTKKIDDLELIVNNIFKQSQVQMEHLVSSIDLQGDKNIDNIKKLIDEFKSEMGAVSEEINKNINENTKINSEAKSILKEICNINIELSKNLSSNYASLAEKLIAIEDKIGESNNKTDVVISGIVDNSKNIKITNENILESNNKLGEIIIKSDGEVEKLIDIKSCLGNLYDKSDEMASIDSENKDILSSIKDDNGRFNMELRNKIDDSIDSNNNIVTKYDIIQKSFAAELLKVACKNENITNLLKDNYKILNGIADSI